MPYIYESNNDQVLQLKNRVNVFRDIVDTLESNPVLANSSTKTLVDLTKALKETEKFLRKYSELQDTRSGRLYSYCFCFYKAEFIKDLMGRLNQCALDLGLQQIIDTRVDAADMIQHVLKEFVDQPALSDKERETLRTDMERYFLELKAQLGEIENKSASDLKEIFTKEVKEKFDGAMADISAHFSTLSSSNDLKHGEVIFGQGLAARKLDNLVEGAQQIADKIDFAIEGGEGNHNT